MFFLMRCIFWLSLVFSHLQMPDNARPGQDASAMAAELVFAAVRTFGEKIEDVCLAKTAECFEAAKILGAIDVSVLAPPSAPAKSAQNSLTPQDVATVWRGAQRFVRN